GVGLMSVVAKELGTLEAHRAALQKMLKRKGYDSSRLGEAKGRGHWQVIDPAGRSLGWPRSPWVSPPRVRQERRSERRAAFRVRKGREGVGPVAFGPFRACGN